MFFIRTFFIGLFIISYLSLDLIIKAMPLTQSQVIIKSYFTAAYINIGLLNIIKMSSLPITVYISRYTDTICLGYVFILFIYLYNIY